MRLTFRGRESPPEDNDASLRPDPLYPTTRFPPGPPALSASTSSTLYDGA